MKAELNNRQIWHEIDHFLASIDLNLIVKNHLEDCNYKISGYWDENEFYEEIAFVGSVRADLVSSSMGVTVGENKNSYWIKHKFLLIADTSVEQDNLASELDKKIGILLLIFDENLEFIDENWLIDVKSLFVVAKKNYENNIKLKDI